MNLNRIDLNLFAVFDAIYTAGSLTKAADVLCITQPAVSSQIRQIESALEIPVFEYVGRKLYCTPAGEILAKSIHRLYLPICVPSFLLKLAFGEMAVILLEGSRVSSEKIKKSGFTFLFPSLKKALQDIH